MKHCLPMLLAAALLAVALPLEAQAGAAPAAAPELHAEFDINYFKLPAGVYFGECVGVAVDSQGDIYVANRGKHPLMEFHPDGSFMRFVGEGLDVFDEPHSVAIDAADDIWYVDAGSNLVVELDPQTRLKMVLGKKPEAWTWETHVVEHGPVGPDDFYQPTGVAFAADGSTFVTDGYGNSRVAHFGADGKFLQEWGWRGAAPGQFNTPHGLVIAADGTLYVADRGNRRIQVFTPQGKLVKIIDGVGAPWALCITRGPNQVIWSADGVAGRFYKLDLSGRVLGEFGAAGHGLGEFGWTHGIACPTAGVIYAAEELNYRVQKITVGGSDPGTADRGDHPSGESQ